MLRIRRYPSASAAAAGTAAPVFPYDDADADADAADVSTEDSLDSLRSGSAAESESLESLPPFSPFSPLPFISPRLRQRRSRAKADASSGGGGGGGGGSDVKENRAPAENGTGPSPAVVRGKDVLTPPAGRFISASRMLFGRRGSSAEDASPTPFASQTKGEGCVGKGEISNDGTAGDVVPARDGRGGASAGRSTPSSAFRPAPGADPLSPLTPRATPPTATDDGGSTPRTANRADAAPREAEDDVDLRSALDSLGRSLDELRRIDSLGRTKSDDDGGRGVVDRGGTGKFSRVPDSGGGNVDPDTECGRMMKEEAGVSRPPGSGATADHEGNTATIADDAKEDQRLPMLEVNDGATIDNTEQAKPKVATEVSIPDESRNVGLSTAGAIRPDGYNLGEPQTWSDRRHPPGERSDVWDRPDDDNCGCAWIPGPLLAFLRGGTGPAAERGRSAVVAPRPPPPRRAGRSAESTLRSDLRAIVEDHARVASPGDMAAILSEVRAIEESLDRISALTANSSGNA